MLTHRNFVAGVAGTHRIGSMVEGSDSVLSYLPLAHLAERSMLVHCYFHGVRIGFYHGNVLKLREDLAMLRPTFFGSVPRLLQKIVDLIRDKFDKLSGSKKAFVEAAFRVKEYYLQRGIYSHPIFDPLIFDKVKQSLGGRVRCIAVGAAPIS